MNNQSERLRAAFETGDGLEVQKLLKASHELVRWRDGRKFPPLYWAAQDGHVQVASVLLDAGADVVANHEHPGGDPGWIHRTQADY